MSSCGIIGSINRTLLHSNQGICYHKNKSLSLTAKLSKHFELSIKYILLALHSLFVGNMAEFDPVRLSKVTPFEYDADHELAIDVVVNWFAEDEIEFGCLYMNEPDSTGHKYIIFIEIQVVELAVLLLYKRTNISTSSI